MVLVQKQDYFIFGPTVSAKKPWVSWEQEDYFSFCFVFLGFTKYGWADIK